MKPRLFNKREEDRLSSLISSGQTSDPSVIRSLAKLDRTPDPAEEKIIIGTVGVIAAVAIFVPVQLTGFLKGAGKGAVLLIMVGAMIAAGIAQAYYRSRFAFSWQSTHCRNCGYALDDLPSEQQATINGTQRPLGPSTCPECGQRWPLVFPA